MLLSLVYSRLRGGVRECYVQAQTFKKGGTLALQGNYKYVQALASTLVSCASFYDMPWYFKQKFWRWRQSWTSLELEQKMSSNLVNIWTKYLQYTRVGLYTNVKYDK